jgi:cyanophycin synthetase
MKIVEQRFLRGPNLYARKPCLLTILDLEDLYEVASKDVDGFTDRLVGLIPSVYAHRCSVGTPGGFIQRLRDGTYMAHIVEHVTLELQCLAGDDVGYGRAREVRGKPGHYRVVCAYRNEAVVAEALRAAVEIVGTLAHGGEPDYAALLDNVRATARRCAVGTSTAAVLKAARARNIPVQRVTDNGNLFVLGWGSKQKRLRATITGMASHIAVELASDKQLTKALLEQAGVPVPEGTTVTTVEQAQRAARRLRGAATLKPLDGNQGKGVTVNCTTPEQVAAAFEFARRYSRDVIVERHVSGRDYRVLVTGDRVAAASYRRPPGVTGDGVRTLRELVEIENADPARGDGHTNILTKIPLDAHALDLARAQGYGLDSVVPAGVEVTLRGNANLSTGGTAEDVTDLLPEDTRELCVRAARTIGLDVAGIDIVCEDIARPLAAQRGAVIEVNAAPGIRMHEFPSRGKPRDAGAAIVESMFGMDNGRIPLVAVTGTNGKTTTSLLIAHTARMAGYGTGLTTTEGVYINDRLVKKGDCTGYHSARTILGAPEVDYAVLETARGGILKRGLAYDRSDVAVVLNVSADHLGMDGIDSVGDLARVKGVVADTASKAVVLNAEDPHCVAMADTVRKGVEIIYFSLDAENAVLLRHLAGGGRALYLQDSSLVLAHADRHEALLDVRGMPVTLGGRARHNIANALAAAGALLATGIGTREIAAGLSTFVSDSAHNPLRANVYEVDGVTVIVDYAHNCAAYAALAATARAMSGGRVIGVVSAPGDRRDGDLAAIGRACGAGFDELVIYEAENRGRADGETAALLLEGARDTLAPDQLATELDSRAAIRAGLARCRLGDVLVFGCGSSLDELRDALGAAPHAVAERRADEVTVQ